jgi:hypothetical protein
MDKVTYVGNADVTAIDHLYQAYLSDPSSVDIGWQKFFEGFDFARTNFDDGGDIPENFQKEFKVLHFLSEEENPKYNFGIFEESILNYHVPDFKEHSTFFCGPEPLKRIVFSIYNRENLETKILSENFGLFNQKEEDVAELQNQIFEILRK